MNFILNVSNFTTMQTPVRLLPLSLNGDLLDPALSTDSFRRLLKTRLFSQY